MENVDQLFLLIHSLSKSEKKHFKIYSSLQGGNKIYVKLFDLIERQRQYNEKKLKSKLKIKAFSVVKIYLYNLILKSLRSQNHPDNKKNLVIDLLENAETLLKKGLYEQSHKQLMRAKKIAQKFQLFSLLIEVHQMEHVIANTSQHVHYLEELYLDSNKEFNHSISALKEQFEYRKGINLILYKFAKQGRVLRSEKEKDDMENSIIELLNRNPETCLSFKAKTFHYNVSGLYYFSNNNIEASYNQSKKSILHLKSDKDMFTQHISNYIDTLNNIMNALMAMKRYKAILPIIAEMKKLPIKSLTEKARVFALATSHEINYYTVTGEYQNGITCIEELKKQISLQQSKLNHPAFYALCSNIVGFYFVNGNFKQALQWNNRVLDHPEIKLYHDYYSYARIAEIIIHYELDNVDTFKSLVSSYQLFLKRNSLTRKYELACSNFFKQIAGTTDSQRRKQLFMHFSNQLQELSANSYETRVFDIFDLPNWIQSKIIGEGF